MKNKVLLVTFLSNIKKILNAFRVNHLLAMSCFLILSISGNAQVSQSSKSPLMGWASWNNYSVNINDSIIRAQADAMVSSGLASAGYNYLNIDDGFFNGRDASGAFRSDSIKFPYGMKGAADYIHSKGLKAGIYSDAGNNTCGSIYNNQKGGTGAGLYMHDQQDANLFFNTWGYDYVKVDYCGSLVAKQDEKTRYTAIKNALDNTGKAYNFNICRWQFPGSWVTSVGSSWRISTDIYNAWNSITAIIDANAYLAAFSSQGHYNDMDMLEVGRGGLTSEEQKSHFSMWCMLSSPLILGNDLGNISAQTKTILTNLEVIAVDQDTTGLQGHIVTDNGAGLQVWAKKLNGKQSNEWSVVFFNRTTNAASMSVKWADLNIVGAATVRDLWLHTDLGSTDSNYTATVPAHGAVMLKVVGTQSKLQEVFEADYGWINNFNLSQNTVVLANQGVATKDAVYAGGAKAGWLGNGADNYVAFRDIYAAVDGNYNLTLTYLSGVNRSATITINGTDSVVLTGLNSGGWEVLKDAIASIKLNKGYNTIRISNATDYLPDLDKIRLDLNAALPLNLLQFNGKRVNNINRLNWSTSEDMSASVFIIESSTDGKTWSTTANVNAQSNTLSYEFTDINAGSGNNYYRLKMLDKDGAYQYSKIIYIASSTDVLNIIKTNNRINITGGRPNSRMAIEVYNSMGKVVQAIQTIIPSIKLVTTYLNKLPAGTYIIHAATDEFVKSQKIIVN